jgi:hypothetical protein
VSTIKSSAENLTLNADGSGNDIKFQSNASEVAEITDGGVISSTGGSTHADNVKAKFGTGDDLEIYHSGSHSIIKDTGTGDLKIKTSLLNLENAAGTANLAYFRDGGNVELYHNGSKKIETTATGVTVTGAIGGATNLGKLLQVVEHTVTSGSRNDAAYGDLYSVNITPSATSSKILVMASVGGLYMNLSSATNQTHWRLARTITGGSEEAPTGHNTNYHTEMGRNMTSAGTRAAIEMTVLDEPSTTTETKYAVQCRRHSGSGGISICDTGGTSSIVLMEIGG